MRNIILKYNLILFFILPLIIPTIAMSQTSVSEYSMLVDEDWSSVMFIYRNIDNDETGAWGLVVNKPLASVPLGSIIYESKNITPEQKKLYNVKIIIYFKIK